MTTGGIMEIIGRGEATKIKLTSEQLCARRARSIAIALALGAFVLLIFAVTIVRLGSDTLSGPDYMRPAEAIGRI